MALGERAAPHTGWRAVRWLLAICFVSCGPVAESGYGTCKAYVTCSEATVGPKGALDATYGTMGTCWTTTDQAATTCRRACDLAITDLQRAFPDAGCVAN